MKVMMYVHWAGVGGAEDMTLDEIRNADRAAIEYEFCTEAQSGEGACLEELRAAGVPVFRLGEGQHEFEALYRERRPDLVHVYSCGDVLAGYGAALNLNIPVVDSIACVSYSAGYERAPALAHPVYLCYKHHEHGGGGKPQFRVIVGGIDLDRLPQMDLVECKRSWGLDPGRPVVGWLGRHDQFKMPFTFVRVAEQLAAARPDLQFVMFGDGVDRGRAEFLARQAGTPLRFVGFTRDKARAYGAMDVLVFCTWQEAFGRVAAEGLAAGRPIVTADYPVCHEVCADFARYVENAREDPAPRRVAEAYVQAVLEALSLPNPAGWGALSRARAERLFSADRMAAEYGALYKEVLNG